jgi:hypothetical protein
LVGSDPNMHWLLLKVSDNACEPQNTNTKDRVVKDWWDVAATSFGSNSINIPESRPELLRNTPLTMHKRSVVAAVLVLL